MPPELDRFRAKYPQYGDMDDMTLATKLYKAHPEYEDIYRKTQLEQEGRRRQQIQRETETAQGRLTKPVEQTLPQTPSPTTPEQVLSEESSLGAGLGAFGENLSQGFSGVTSGSLVKTVMGAAQMFGAPQAGLGRMAGNTTQNLLARVPGLGGAEGVIPAAGAALADAAVQMAPIGLVSKGIQVLRRAGKAAKTEAVAGVLGREADPVARAVVGKQPVRAAYKKAERITTPVDTNTVVNNGITKADDILDPKLQQKVLDALPQSSQIPYNQLVKAEQEITVLMKQARDPIAKAAIRDIRRSMVEASATVDDALVKANKIAAQFSAGDKVFDLVNKAKDSTSALTRFDSLLNKESETIVAHLGGGENVKLLRAAIQKGIKGDNLRALLDRMGRAALIAGSIGVGANVFGRHVANP